MKQGLHGRKERINPTLRKMTDDHGTPPSVVHSPHSFVAAMVPTSSLQPSFSKEFFERELGVKPVATKPPPPPPPPPTVRQPTHPPSHVDPRFKSKLCLHWMRGNHNKDDKHCTYAHGPDEIQKFYGRPRHRVGEAWGDSTHASAAERLLGSRAPPRAQFDVDVVEYYMRWVYEAFRVVSNEEARTTAYEVTNTVQTLSKLARGTSNRAVREVIEKHAMEVIRAAFNILCAAA